MDVKETSKQNSNSELLKREPIEDTPFEVVTTEKGSFVGMGMYRMTEVYDKPEHAKDAIMKLTWKNVINVFAIMINELNKPVKQ